MAKFVVVASSVPVAATAFLTPSHGLAGGAPSLRATAQASEAAVVGKSAYGAAGAAAVASGSALLACAALRRSRRWHGSFAARNSRQVVQMHADASTGAAKAKKLTMPYDLLGGVDIFIFDCDGVIWRGDSLIDGVPAVLDKLRAMGKRCFFVTNNSTKSRAGYKAKFTSLGLDIPPEEIFSSSFAAAAYLEQTKFKESGKKVYVIGEKGIGEELDLIGVPWFGGEGDKGVQAPMQPGGAVTHDPNVGAVIVGFDRYINYFKLQYAQLCLNENPGCQFIATNLDRVTHLTDAQEWAGNGTMVGAVSGCTGMSPTVVGKPAPLMIDYLAEKFNITDRHRICMVGDRLDTDIAFGNNNGLQTCLTLSGVTSLPELMDEVPRKKGTEGIQPEYYVETICDFFC
mmetsp:Transcript_62681/g.136122  ORF Transcript_62681/g.136122 Transcript_62681/m.136122 type:complete len:400 (-) Transcript_62681:230-1429(-)